MAGEPIFQSIPFVGGLDEKTAKEWEDPSKSQAAIVNGNFEKVGSISKRLGVARLPNALAPGSSIPAISEGVRAAAWSRSGLAVMGAGGLYTYSEAEDGLVGAAEIPSVPCVRRPVVTSPTRTKPTFCDLPYGGTTLRVSIYWDNDYNLVAAVYDLDNGDVVLEPVEIFPITGSLGAGTIPVLVSAFYLPNSGVTKLFVLNNQNAGVYAIDYNPSTNSFSSASLLFSVAGAGGVGLVDIMPFQDDPAGGYVAAYSTSTTNLRVRWYSSANAVLLTKDQALPGAEVFATCPFALTATYGASERVWVTYQTYLAPNYRTYVLCMSGDGLFTTQASSPTLLIGPSSTTTFFISGSVRLGPDDLLLLYRRNAVSTNGSLGPSSCLGSWYRVNASATLTLAATGPTPYGFYPVSKPFVAADGEFYQAYYYNPYLTAGGGSGGIESQQVTLYLCKFVGMSPTIATTNQNIVYPVCTVAPRTVEHRWQLILDLFQLFRIPCPSNLDPSAERVAVGLKTKGVTTSSLSGSLGPAWSADFFFTPASRRDLYQSSELGTELSLSGGVPFVADGQTAFEDSFFHYPEFSYATLAGSGNFSVSGTYFYAVVYSYVDAAGLLHQSAPVFTNSVVASGGQSGQLTITPLSVTYRDLANPGEVFADIYRTLGNGSVFYFLDRIVVSGTPPAVPGISWPTSGTGDNQSDASLQEGATLLYTTGGVLDNVNPPASHLQTSHRGRKVVVDELRRNVWFSKQFSEGEAPGFNEALIVPFPEGGDITAVRSMDDKLVVFKASSIWVMTGDGPADTGQGSDWSVPQQVSTDVGCVSGQSVVLTPAGLMFKAPNGLYMLGRDLQVSFVGKAVVDILTDFPVVTSATLVPSSTQVRFTCTDEAGTSSTVAVFDYLLGQWTQHEYPHLSAPIASAVLSYHPPQQFCLLTEDGEIWQERLPTDAEKNFDTDVTGARQFVTTSVTIPWQKTQVQGYMRVRRFQLYCSQEDDCGVKLEFAFDGDETVRQTSTWQSYQLSALPLRGQVEAHVAAQHNSCQMFQVTVSDFAGTSMTSGAGMRFVSGAYEIVPKGQRFRGIPVGGRQ